MKAYKIVKYYHPVLNGWTYKLCRRVINLGKYLSIYKCVGGKQSKNYNSTVSVQMYTTWKSTLNIVQEVEKTI